MRSLLCLAAAAAAVSALSSSPVDGAMVLPNIAQYNGPSCTSYNTLADCFIIKDDTIASSTLASYLSNTGFGGGQASLQNGVMAVNTNGYFDMSFKTGGLSAGVTYDIYVNLASMTSDCSTSFGFYLGADQSKASPPPPVSSYSSVAAAMAAYDQMNYMMIGGAAAMVNGVCQAAAMSTHYQFSWTQGSVTNTNFRLFFTSSNAKVSTGSSYIALNYLTIFPRAGPNSALCTYPGPPTPPTYPLPPPVPPVNPCYDSTGVNWLSSVCPLNGGCSGTNSNGFYSAAVGTTCSASNCNGFAQIGLCQQVGSTTVPACVCVSQCGTGGDVTCPLSNLVANPSLDVTINWSFAANLWWNIFKNIFSGASKLAGGVTCRDSASSNFLKIGLPKAPGLWFGATLGGGSTAASASVALNSPLQGGNSYWVILSVRGSISSSTTSINLFAYGVSLLDPICQFPTASASVSNPWHQVKVNLDSGSTVCTADTRTTSSSGSSLALLPGRLAYKFTVPTGQTSSAITLSHQCGNGGYTVIDFVIVVPVGSSTTDCPIIPSGANGDPQFTGFLGQSYQVHGVSNQVYNILSAPSFQYNALFTYLDEGKCRPGTQCFAHPGNYFGAVALLLAGQQSGDAVQTLEIVSGPVAVGLNATLNGAPLVEGVPITVQMRDGEATIELVSPFEVEIRSPVFDLRVQNSDMFLNQDVAVSGQLLEQISAFKALTKSGKANDEQVAAMRATMPHGVLGQTWERVEYANRWKYIAGSLFEYELADGLTGTDFKYNRFAQ